jgi:hypothetical protein
MKMQTVCGARVFAHLARGFRLLKETRAGAAARA